MKSDVLYKSFEKWWRKQHTTFHTESDTDYAEEIAWQAYKEGTGYASRLITKLLELERKHEEDR